MFCPPLHSARVLSKGKFPSKLVKLELNVYFKSSTAEERGALKKLFYEFYTLIDIVEGYKASKWKCVII